MSELGSEVLGVHLGYKVSELVRLVNGSDTEFYSEVDPKVIVSERMLNLRTQLGLGQAEFAKLIGETRQLVYKWDEQLSFPRPGELMKAAKALGTSVSYLYGETDDPRPAVDWHGAGPSSATEAAIEQTAAELGRLQGELLRLLPGRAQDAPWPAKPSNVVELLARDAYGNPRPARASRPEGARLAAREGPEIE